MAEPRLAATMLLARDAADGGVELCMIVRNREVEFASGALVFPGGSVDAADAAARGVCDGADALDERSLRLSVAALREAFEECGLLLARRGGALIGGDEASRLTAAHRGALLAGDATIFDLARAEGLTLAVDLLTPYAHWITPAFMKKRFDTRFFVAAAPADHRLSHDGGEAVDALWIAPQAAIDAADAGLRTLVFATRLNLEMAGEAESAADLVARAAARDAAGGVVAVEPVMEMRDGRRTLSLPPGAGYRHSTYYVDDPMSPPTPLRDA